MVFRYVYDNEDIILEYDGTNTLQASYTHGPGIDEPLIMERGGQSFFYHTDGLGSITDLTDSTGAVIQSYVYDSFGNVINQTGSVVNTYTYTGRELDSESGLYYYRARYYNPTIGRFLQEDPIGFLGGINKFVYTLNNPINFTDPSGLVTLEQCEAVFQAEVIFSLGATNQFFFGGVTNEC
jgi:RHS repeat-associated protein